MVISSLIEPPESTWGGLLMTSEDEIRQPLLLRQAHVFFVSTDCGNQKFDAGMKSEYWATALFDVLAQ